MLSVRLSHCQFDRLFVLSLQVSQYLSAGSGHVVQCTCDNLTRCRREACVWGRAMVIITYMVQMQCQARIVDSVILACILET